MLNLPCFPICAARPVSLLSLHVLQARTPFILLPRTPAFTFFIASVTELEILRVTLFLPSFSNCQ